MADITMCGNSEKCPKKASCYRVTAIPDQWQAYSDFYTGGPCYSFTCEEYWKTDTVSKPKRTRRKK